MVKVIEWPEPGSARQFPVGGWWVVEENERGEYTPLAGPFSTRTKAEKHAKSTPTAEIRE